MKRFGLSSLIVATAIGLSIMSMAYAESTSAAPPATTPAPGSQPPLPANSSPEVPAAAPGVFTMTKKGGSSLHLTVTGHTFTSRDAIEKYLAYRAAAATMSEHASWFLLVEHRMKGDSVPMPKKDPSGMRYSFRLAYFQPTWRFKTASSPNWKTWSPFSGKPFFADGLDPKSITAYEASVDIQLRKGMMEDDNPLAFEADALSDFLVNQVSPPS